MLFPNEGWETGDAGGWTFENSGWGNPSVEVSNPRTGLYSLYFSTPFANVMWARARYAVPAAKVASLRGKTVIFRVWHWVLLIFAGGIGQDQYIRIEDGVSYSETTLPYVPYSTWMQVSTSRLIHPLATKVEFIIYWLKAGGGSIYRIYEDDMESDPVNFPSLGAGLPPPAARELLIGV